MDRFREMKVFVAVAETGGLAKAAAKLRSSPPAVTRTITALERRLGVELLTRTTRSVRVTEEGQLFLKRARHLLSELEFVEKEVSGDAGMPSGRLTISTPVLMGRSILPPIVSGFLSEQPRLTANVLLLDRVVNIVEEGIDVALRVGLLPDSTLIARKVGYGRRVLVASPAYLAEHSAPKTASDLKQHAIIGFTGHMPNREWTYVSKGRVSRIALEPRMEINDGAAAIKAAEAGEGITIAMSYMVDKQIRERRLLPLLLPLCPPAVPIHLVYPESRLVAPKVRAFIDYAVPKLGAALQQAGP
jgi:DNA-binding transcriptional LysR family regulator